MFVKSSSEPRKAVISSQPAGETVLHIFSRPCGVAVFKPCAHRACSHRNDDENMINQRAPEAINNPHLEFSG